MAAGTRLVRGSCGAATVGFSYRSLASSQVPRDQLPGPTRPACYQRAELSSSVCRLLARELLWGYAGVESVQAYPRTSVPPVSSCLLLLVSSLHAPQPFETTPPTPSPPKFGLSLLAAGRFCVSRHTP